MERSNVSSSGQAMAISLIAALSRSNVHRISNFKDVRHVFVAIVPPDLHLGDIESITDKLWYAHSVKIAL